MMRPIALLLPLLLALAGCNQNQFDPYKREGVWRPNGANADNLRAMVAVPADLVEAMPASPANGVLAAEALNRLRQDRVRPLPDSGLAQIVPVSGGTPAQPAAAPASGTGN
jgi:hypothetical protein